MKRKAIRRMLKNELKGKLNTGHSIVPQAAQAKPAFKSIREIVNFFKLNIQVLLLIAVISIISYANGLNGQFIIGDDTAGIVQNQELRDFGEAAKSYNINLIFDSAMVNIFGVSPAPFHIAILLIHILNSYLVLLLAYLLFGKRVSLYASLLFSVLPVGSEAVFWVSGIGYIFQAFFSLICINIFFLFRITGDRRLFIASSLIFLLSLIVTQTPWMFTIPFIIISLDLFTVDYIKYRVLVKRWWQYAAFLSSIGLFWFVFMRGQFSVRMTALTTDYYFNPAESTPLLKRLPYTIYKTVELYIFPWRLSFFHEETLSATEYAFMVVVTVMIILLVAYLLYRKSKSAGLLLAIVASIAPTFSPVQIAWFIAERYLYLGGAFFAMILSLLIIKVDYRYNIKNLAGYILSVLLILYSARLIIRANDFKSSKALWLATQKTAPASYRVYNNLGDAYGREQNWEMTIASFKKSIELAPNYADAIHNLGFTYMQIGDYENAKKYLLESYQKNGRFWQALDKLGRIEYAQGNKEKAKEYFEEARKVNPQFIVPAITP